jgi:hypothetical protein
MVVLCRARPSTSTAARHTTDTAGLRLFTVAGAAQTIRLARINRKFATTISTIARFPQGGGHESMVAGGSSFGGSKAG